MGRRTDGWWHAVATVPFTLALVVATLARAEEAPRSYGEKADTLGTPQPEAEEKGPNRGRMSWTIGSDITNAYFFRGILQERHGFIWEPYVETSVSLYEGDGALSTVSAGLGLWWSVQTQKTGASGSGPSNLYEMDIYPSVTLGWSPGIETSLSYVVYTGPNGSFDTVQQIDLGIAYDDSDLLGPFALGPNMTFSFEVDNSSFGNPKEEGGYFELAGSPGTELATGDVTPALEDYPITLSFPLALGLSLYDYYRTEPPVKNETFGFFSFGATAGIPLAFIPEDYGSWTMSAGINVPVLGKTLKDVNLPGQETLYPVGVWSVVMTY